MIGYIVVFGAFGAVLVAIGLSTALKALTRERTSRLIERTVAVPIAAVVGGSRVKIVGQLRLATEEALVSPFAARRCAYFAARVENYGGDSAFAVASEVEAQEFLIEDMSGRAIVRVNNNMRVHLDEHTFTVAPDAKRIDLFLRRHGRRTAELRSRHLHYVEGVLEPGQRVAVMGLASWELDPQGPTSAGGYRETARRLVLEQSATAPLLVSDDPDG